MKKCEFCGASLDVGEKCLCRIRVLVKEQGKPSEERVIENDHRALSEIVGGAFMTLAMGPIVLVARYDDEIKDQMPDVRPVDVKGTVIAAGDYGDELRSLHDWEIVIAKMMLDKEDDQC